MTGQGKTSAKAGDFSQGRVSLVIMRLGLPMMLAEFVHVLYNIVDRMYIGHMAQGGTLALTGLGICFPLITLIGAFANLYSTGGATLATIARGEQDDRKAERIMGTSFTMLLITGFLLTVILYISAPVTLRWLGGDDETIPAAMDYFRIYVAGTIPVLISLGMNPFISAQGFPKIGMMTILIGPEDRHDDDPDRRGAEHRAGSADDLYAGHGYPRRSAGNRHFPDGQRDLGAGFPPKQAGGAALDRTAS